MLCLFTIPRIRICVSNGFGRHGRPSALLNTGSPFENLGDKEIWLPMIDSLDIDWSLPEDTKLLNFYVEKGGDTPSAQGTHQEMIDNGYKWIGKSSTYELPSPGVTREIIPAELVYRADRPQSGWFAGIEFSGRTRIALDRKGDGLSSSLGLNPDPGPFRTRLDPEDEFETPAVFLGTFRDGPDSAANQLHPWVRAVLGNPLTWRDPRYPAHREQQLGQRNASGRSARAAHD